ARSLRYVGRATAVRALLGARRRVLGLASLLVRLLGLHRLRLDVDLRRAVGLGHLSLRALAGRWRIRLGLGSRQRLGAGMGSLAHERRLGRMGGASSRREMGPGGTLRLRRQLDSRR